MNSAFENYIKVIDEVPVLELLNNQQLSIVKSMLDEGTKGFEGGMNVRK